MPDRTSDDGPISICQQSQHRSTHLVDREEVSALGSIRVIPFQPLVHVCFAFPELARQAWVDRQRSARQGKARQGKARQGKARQGKARQGAW